MKALINARIYDYHNYLENRCIVFDEKIRAVLDMSEVDLSEFDEVIDAYNQLVIPGFVSGHTHLYSAFARGINLEYNPHNFQEILEQMWWKLDHFLDLETIYYSAYSFAVEQLMAGTTTLIDHHASFLIENSLNTIKKALCDDLKIRAILAFETSDRFDINRAIKENSDFIKNNKTNNCCGLFGLHASYTLSDETLLKVKNNLHGAGIHIHVAESISDESITKEKYQCNILKRLENFGLLNDKSLLVHCTNVSAEELDIIKKYNSKIVLNFTSNMNNAVGLPDFQAMNKKKIDCLIGNDGLISSMPIEYINAYYASHLKTNNPIGLSLSEIKQSIINTYEYTSKLLNIKMGRIKVGYVSDFITVPYSEFTPINKENIFGHIFFGLFPNLKPKSVFSQGKELIKNYNISDEMNVKLKKAKKVSLKLWKTIEKEGNHLEFKY